MIGFPLLLIPLAIYNIIVFLMPGVSFAAPLVTVPLMSGTAWTVTLSDAMLAFGLFLLLLEIVKGARPLGKYLTDHLLAFLIFAGAAAEFLMLPQFASSTFFLLTMLTLVDFLSGISLRARRPRRGREVILPASVEDDLVTQPRVVAVKPAPLDPPAPVIVRPEPIVAETIPARPVDAVDAHPIRTEPILDTTADVAEIERERRADEVIVPGRIPPIS